MSRSSSLSGRVALVTGVSRRIGIGAALAARLLDDGASVLTTGFEAFDEEMPWDTDSGGAVAALAARGSWEAEPGEFEVFVGTSSAKVNTGQFTLLQNDMAIHRQRFSAHLQANGNVLAVGGYFYAPDPSGSGTINLYVTPTCELYDMASGGVAGLLIGMGLAALLSVVGIPTHIPPAFVAMALAVSLAVGLLSGILPARRAARLDPVVALGAE